MILEMNTLPLPKKRGGAEPLIVWHLVSVQHMHGAHGLYHVYRGGSGRRKEGLVRREEKQERKRRLCLLLSTTRLRLMFPPSFSLCVSRSSQRAVSGSQQQGGENIESMLPPAFESRVSV